MVRLKPAIIFHCFIPPLLYFNPTMVRLKHFNEIKMTALTIIFQSHNGSIKTLLCLKRNETKHEFQSHNGSIKT